MKKQIIWTKTILTVYRYLERICGAIDKIVLQSGLNSSNILGNNYFQNNIYAITDRIINLSQRKVTLINLKILTEEILMLLQPLDAQLLIEKYVDLQKCKSLSETHNIPLRTLFRKIASAEESFDSKLKIKGYSNEKLEKLLECEQWIKNVYNSFEQNDEFEISKGFIDKAASM